MLASSAARQNRAQGTLVQAAEAGDFGAAEVLIAAGADVNSATEHGMTALMTAAANGHLGLVSLLLERGADINAKRYDGLDALGFAVFFGHLHVVRELLGRGADLKAESWFATSPEMWATARGFYDIAQVLTDAKMAKSRETPAQSDESNAPLPELTGAQEPILSEAFFSDEGLPDEASSHVTPASPTPVRPDSTYDYEWSMGSIDSSELTIESPVSVWNMTDEAHKENQVQPRKRGTNAEPMAAEVTHNGAGKLAPVITQPPRALPDEKQPFPIYSTYVAKPRYHHRRKSGKLVRCLAYITSDWQRLTVATLIVMLLCGLGTVAFLKLLSPSKPSRVANPVKVAEPSAADLSHLNTQSDRHSTTRAEEVPSPSTISNTSDEQSADSPKRSDDGSGLRVKRIEHPSSSSVAEQPLRKSAERFTAARPKQGMTPKREAPAVSSPAPTIGSAGVSAKGIRSQNTADAADIALKDRGAKAPAPAHPAPLSIEIQRPRSVAARNNSPAPAATPGRITKTKVIQWP